MKLTRLLGLSAVLLVACGGTGTGDNPLQTSGGGQPVGKNDPGAGKPVGVITNPGHTGSDGGSSGTGGGPNTGGTSGVGGGGNLTCDGVCAACGGDPTQCSALCAQFELTQDQLLCMQQSNCLDESCLTSGSGGTGGGTGGTGGGTCLPDGTPCEFAQDCCSLTCSGFCGTTGSGGTGGSSECGLSGDFCSFPEDCCSFNCVDGFCF